MKRLLIALLLLSAFCLSGCPKESPPEEKKPAAPAPTYDHGANLPRPAEVRTEVQNSVDTGSDRTKNKIDDATK